MAESGPGQEALGFQPCGGEAEELGHGPQVVDVDSGDEFPINVASTGR